jgi:hypothetical protein
MCTEMHKKSIGIGRTFGRFPRIFLAEKLRIKKSRKIIKIMYLIGENG